MAQFFVKVKNEQGEVTHRFSVNALTIHHAQKKVDKLWLQKFQERAYRTNIYKYKTDANNGQDHEWPLVKIK